jgi:hypothetical protein
MLPTLLVAAALVAANDSGSDLPELHKMPVSACKLPIIFASTDITRAQLYVSTDRGRTWTFHQEVARDQGSFTFRAGRPGEYWFFLRAQHKDGTFDRVDCKPELRVLFAAGSEAPAPETPERAPSKAEELDREMKQLELDLIRFEVALLRKELKRLTEESELTPTVEERMNRLRAQLKRARERLRAADTDAPAPRTDDPLGLGPTTGESKPMYPVPGQPRFVPLGMGAGAVEPLILPTGPVGPAEPVKPVKLPPVPRADDSLPADKLPSRLPVIPAAPALVPAAPPPHAPARR